MGQFAAKRKRKTEGVSPITDTQTERRVALGSSRIYPAFNMISRITGEVKFQNLLITPQMVLPSALVKKSRSLSIPGWSGHQLGVRQSELGAFDVEVLTDKAGHVQLALLAHAHPFYKRSTPDDAERRAFHEGVMDSELAGQREFSWGEVLCRLDKHANKDWLVVAYNQGPHVPAAFPKVLLHLHARQPYPMAD
jgi:hypothetical protein